MSSVISAIQSYSNIIGQNNAQSSIMNNNEIAMQAVRNMDVKTIEKIGPDHQAMSSLAKADKQRVLENVSNGMKAKFLEAWQGSLDKKMEKEFAKDFNVFGD